MLHDAGRAGRSTRATATWPTSASGGWSSASGPPRAGSTPGVRGGRRGGSRSGSRCATRLLDLAEAIARFADGADRARRARARHADARLHLPAGRAADDRRPLAAVVRLPRAARRSSGALADFDVRRTAARPAPAASTARASRSTASGSPPLLGFSGADRAHARRDVADRRLRRAPPRTRPIAATGASRFAEDVEIYGSDEFGLLRIGDELCRASALMPQKRNPYALVVIRGGARTLLGRATGVLAAQQTPSGRTDNLLYAYGEVAGAVELATRLLRLAAATAESLTIDRAAAERALRESDAMATDVAEAVSLATGTDYRSAYRAVGRAVAAGDGLDAAAASAALGVRGLLPDLDPAPRSRRARSPAAPRRRRWTRCSRSAARRSRPCASAWSGARRARGRRARAARRRREACGAARSGSGERRRGSGLRGRDGRAADAAPGRGLAWSSMGSRRGGGLRPSPSASGAPPAA